MSARKLTQDEIVTREDLFERWFDANVRAVKYGELWTHLHRGWCGMFRVLLTAQGHIPAYTNLMQALDEVTAAEQAGE